MMKDEEARRIVTMEAFKVADKKSQELTTKLIEVERDRKSTEVAFNGVEKHAKAQLKQAEADLAATRDQIKSLLKKLEEAEKAKD